MNPLQIPAFSNLTTLDWEGRALPFSIACLPQLEYLTINRDCYIEVPSHQNHNVPHISKLTLNRDTTALFPLPSPHADQTNNSVIPFLKRCTFLRHL